MPKRPDLSALASAAGSVRARPQPSVQDNTPPVIEEAPRPTRTAVAPSRAGTKPITGFYPGEVRVQLKVLSAEKGRSMESMLAEALNDLFAKYGKAEIAPVADRSRTGESEH